MVGEHCTRDVVVGQPDETLAAAAVRMRKAHVGNLVVIDDLQTRVPVGVLTDRDIVVGPVAQAADSIADLTVGEVMSSPAVTVRDTDSMDTAVTAMARHGVRRLPVVDEHGAVVGVLAADDVLARTAGMLEKLVRLMANETEQEFDRRRA